MRLFRPYLAVLWRFFRQQASSDDARDVRLKFPASVRGRLGPVGGRQRCEQHQQRHGRAAGHGPNARSVGSAGAAPGATPNAPPPPPRCPLRVNEPPSRTPSMSRTTSEGDGPTKTWMVCVHFLELHFKNATRFATALRPVPLASYLELRPQIRQHVRMLLLLTIIRWFY